MQWVLLPLKRYAEFHGRSRRMEFWSFALFNMILGLVLAGPFYYAMLSATLSVDPNSPGADAAMADAMLSGAGTFGMIGIGLFSLYALATLIPNIAVTVRRLHDRDMSGWWYLGFIVASIIPLIGLLASIAFIVVMFLPGTDGPNRFGEDPKGVSGAETFS